MPEVTATSTNRISEPVRWGGAWRSSQLFNSEGRALGRASRGGVARAAAVAEASGFCGT